MASEVEPEISAVADIVKAAPPPQRFVGLDALRGIAALVVVILHYNLVVWPEIETSTFIGKSDSYLAVDFFIILSGFVLAHAFFDKPGFDLWDFTKKRLFRFWPLHIVTLLATLTVMVAAHQSFDLRGVILNTLLMHNVGIGHWGLAFNVPSWSLSVELAVNLIVGAFVVFAPKRIEGLLLAGLAVLGGSVLLAWHHDLNVHRDNAFHFLNLGLMRGCLSFPLGILIYRFYRAHQESFARASVLRNWLTGMLLVCFVASFYLPGGTRRDFLLIPAYALVVLAMAAPGSFWTGLLSRLRFLGNISFSLYLVHFVILRIMALVRPWPHGYIGGLFLALTVSVAAAWVTHQAFEQPVYVWLTAHWCKRGEGARLPDIALARLKSAKRRAAAWLPLPKQPN